MRIVVMTRFYRNGQMTHVFDLCTELRRRGHEVLLVLSQLHDLIYLQLIKRAGIPHILTAEPSRLQRRLQKWRPQLIHNHSAHTLAAAVELGRVLEIPTLTTVHYLDFEPVELLEKQNGVILISREMEEKFQLTASTYVVENGIVIPPAAPKTKRWRKQALFLAQVTPDKEDNFRLMAESLAAWGWEVVSAGGFRHPQVQNLGWVNQVGPLLKRANLVVGTGRAVREAMAAGCAAWVLGMYSDGLVTPENVEELKYANFSGRATQGAFCPEQAAPLLAQPDPERFRELGIFGRSYALRHFSIQGMTRRLEDIYKTTLEAPVKLEG